MLYCIFKEGYYLIGFNVQPIVLIARNEFKKMAGQPLNFLFAGILVLIAILNGIGFANGLSYFEQIMQGDVFIKVGMSEILWVLSMYCTFAAMFIGLISVAGERTSGSLNLLLSRLLYRKDIIAGKFIGMAVFILILVSMTFIISSLLIILFFRMPYSFTDFFMRLLAFICLLFLESSISACIAMLIGIIFKNLLDASVMVASVLYIEWYTQIRVHLGSLDILSPTGLYIKIISAAPDRQFTGLMDTSLGFMTWFDIAKPYIVFMIFYLIIILLVTSIVFARSEDHV